MDFVILAATIVKTDLMIATVVRTSACLAQERFPVEPMAITAFWLLPPHPGSLVTLRFATNSVQMVTVGSVEVVCLVSSVLM